MTGDCVLERPSIFVSEGREDRVVVALEGFENELVPLMGRCCIVLIVLEETGRCMGSDAS